MKANASGPAQGKLVSLRPQWVGKLIHLHRHLQRQNGEMMICDIGRDINDVLSSSRLNTYFKISPTPEAALSEWQADS